MKIFALTLLACSMLSFNMFSSNGSPAATTTSKPPTASENSDPEEVYTGTIVNTSGRMVSTGFTLRLKGFTSDEDFSRYIGILGEGDQFDVLKAIKDIDLGSFIPTRDVGRQISVARKTQLPDGRTRIAVAFERWLRFAEVRNGYRSEDYPFAIMEIIFDAKGKGTGTFIAACAVDLKRDKKTGQYTLELENFGTYPSRVMGVTRRGK
jgi:hypothetical protein